MFYVINKSKIYSYLIALCTVIILFVAATTINDMTSPSGSIVETGANVTENMINAVIENQITNGSVQNAIENNMMKNHINIVENL